MEKPTSERTTLIFADVRNGDGTMWRAVHITGKDELVIEGHDLGPAVASFHGCTEYKFERSLSTSETTVLRRLLGITADGNLIPPSAVAFAPPLTSRAS